MIRLLISVRSGEKIGCFQDGRAFYCSDCVRVICPPEETKIIYTYKEVEDEADNLQCVSGFA